MICCPTIGMWYCLQNAGLRFFDSDLYYQKSHSEVQLFQGTEIFEITYNLCTLKNVPHILGYAWARGKMSIMSWIGLINKRLIRYRRMDFQDWCLLQVIFDTCWSKKLLPTLFTIFCLPGKSKKKTFNPCPKTPTSHFCHNILPNQ